jgi:hypothetical protein
LTWIQGTGSIVQNMVVIIQQCKKWNGDVQIDSGILLYYFLLSHFEDYRHYCHTLHFIEIAVIYYSL